MTDGNSLRQICIDLMNDQATAREAYVGDELPFRDMIEYYDFFYG